MFYRLGVWEDLKRFSLVLGPGIVALRCLRSQMNRAVLIAGADEQPFVWFDFVCDFLNGTSNGKSPEK